MQQMQQFGTFRIEQRQYLSLYLKYSPRSVHALTWRKWLILVEGSVQNTDPQGKDLHLMILVECVCFFIFLLILTA